MIVIEFNQEPRITLKIFDIISEYDMIPSLVDIDEYNSFKTEKRRLEHISSRIALSEALLSWDIDPEQIQIVRDEKRAPSLKWIQGTFRSQLLPNISISHSNDKAFVALIEANWWVGIDAEPENRMIAENAFDQFCKGEELEYLRTQPEAAIQLWTSKEAVQKAMHLGMHLNPREITFPNRIPIENKTSNIAIENQIIQLKNTYICGYHLSVAWRPAEVDKNDAEDILLEELAKHIRDTDGNIVFDVGCNTTRNSV